LGEKYSTGGIKVEPGKKLAEIVSLQLVCLPVAGNMEIVLEI
jgi:hypothetical protein